MILNVSGRTDIVAFYTKWFIKRYQEGYVDVRNPFYPKLVSRIFFKDVDLIVFCTKNPKPIIPFLKYIKQPIIFHITITPYKKDIEPNVPSKKKIIEAVKEISKVVPREYIYIRYDPVFLSSKYNISYHIKAFNKLCSLLEGYVSKIIISFLDNYKNVQKNLRYLQVKNFSNEDYKKLGLNFSRIAKEHHIIVQTCGEKKDLVEYGFIKDECLSRSLAYKLTGKNFPRWQARNNKNCNCANMVDIGSYNSCLHLCKYCYANYDEDSIKRNVLEHDDNSSLLIGNLNSDDIIKVRKK